MAPPPSKLESSLQPIIKHVLSLGQTTGYRWGKADQVITEETGIPKPRVYRVVEGGRLHNVAREIKRCPDLAVIVVREHEFTVDRLVDRLVSYAPDHPEWPSVVMIMMENGAWRGEIALKREDRDLPLDLAQHFPAVTQIVDVPPPRSATGTATATVQALTPALARDLLTSFAAYAEARGLRYAMSTLLDALACLLSTQLVLFVGPSGSGKSTLARLLAVFFAPADLHRRADLRKGLERPEDFAGSYSPYLETFVTTDYTRALADLANESAEDGTPPVLVLEEANLSPIDGYLSPVMHALSEPSTEVVEWSLYSAPESELEEKSGSSEDRPRIPEWIPTTARLRPFPRFLGTINVDADSPAPARKVASRAAVLLVEADARLGDADIGFKLIDAATRKEIDAAYCGKGADHIGDPESQLTMDSEARRKELAETFADVVRSLFPSRRIAVSPRSRHQAMLYMSFFTTLAPADTDNLDKIAAENAVLHFVLPELQPAEFTELLDNSEALPLLPTAEPHEVGGLLKSRLERLRASRTGPLASLQTIDFWEALG